MMRERERLLEVSGLCVDYGFGDDAVHAVTGADLTLHRGEVFGLAGESGSGKSTLAYAIARLLRMPGVITSGEVIFRHEGTKINLLNAGPTQLRELRWTQLAVVLQSAMHALNPVLTIGVQLTDVLQAHRPELDKTARNARAGELLEMVGITADRLGSYPHELSGGMRQRVMIAMALALEPQIVIMDEPTTALDVVTQREILQELMDLRERLDFAVLFITHDLSLLIEIADAIAVMYAGRLVERASANALFRAPRHPYSHGLLSSFPALHGPKQHLTGIPGSPPDLRQPPAGCAFHPRCPYVMERCRTDVPPLLELAEAGGRFAACWLHDGSTAVPPELSLAVAAAGSRAGAAGGGPPAAIEPASDVRAAPEPGSRAEPSATGPASSTTPTAGSLP